MRIAIIRSGAIGLAILVTVAASDASHSGLNAAAGAVQGYRTVFVITAAVSLASVIIAALLPAKPKPVPAPPPPSERTSSNDHHTAHADVRESLNGQAAPDCPFLRTRPGHVGRGEAEPGASRRQVRRVAGRSSAHGEQGRCHRPPRWTALHQRSRAGHSFDVHRVLHLASTIGLADQLLGDLQRTLFSGRANVYDHAVLADASSHLGIPEDESKKSSQATSTPTQSARTRGKPKRSAPPECPSPSSTVESRSPAPQASNITDIIPTEISGYCDVETGECITTETDSAG